MIKAKEGNVKIEGTLSDIVADFACICTSIKQNYDEELLKDIAMAVIELEDESMECAKAVFEATRAYADRRFHDEREEDDSILNLLKKIAKQIMEDD